MRLECALGSAVLEELFEILGSRGRPDSRVTRGHFGSVGGGHLHWVYPLAAGTLGQFRWASAALGGRPRACPGRCGP
ncbi:hypothetical protein SAMN05421783_1542 [Thiocapsa roseopersicina]|uniref:Uncharacterized protein n=1 Tax=Thiocapsa roseopersicina TaxID=1058 RepID=A0A1H3DMQ6_THIRO|nr:hypothetical protein SAMN05421783_1542 [Thiocapsa roseopersicina]